MSVLNELFLDSNEIKSLKSNDFQYLPRLIRLYLGSNKLSVVNSRAFANLTTLKELYLSNNRIKQVYSDSFMGLNALDTLDLSKNYLSDLNDCLTRLSLVRRVMLSRNSLKSFRFFSNLTRFSILDLSFNLYLDTLVESNRFISELYLQNVPLKPIHNFVFNSLSSLKTLDLSDTLLDQDIIIKINFDSLRKILLKNSLVYFNFSDELLSSNLVLESLDLSYNQLILFKNNFLSNNRMIKTLIMRNTGLTDSKMYSSFNLSFFLYLESLDFSQNELICIKSNFIQIL